MMMNMSFGYTAHSAHALSARRDRHCPEPGPDDTSDPDFPDRDNSGGPDDTSDPDGYSRGSGDTYNGPDGPIDCGPMYL